MNEILRKCVIRTTDGKLIILWKLWITKGGIAAHFVDKGGEKEAIERIQDLLFTLKGEKLISYDWDLEIKAMKAESTSQGRSYINRRLYSLATIIIAIIALFWSIMGPK